MYAIMFGVCVCVCEGKKVLCVVRVVARSGEGSARTLLLRGEQVLAELPYSWGGGGGKLIPSPHTQ